MRVFPCENRVKSSVLHYVSTVPVMAIIIHSKCLSLITAIRNPSYRPFNSCVLIALAFEWKLGLQ